MYSQACAHAVIHSMTIAKRPSTCMDDIYNTYICMASKPYTRVPTGSTHAGVSIEHHADGDRVLCQLEAVRTSVSPRRTSRQGAQQSTQHASYSRTTQPQSLDRKASLSSQHSFPIVEACTMDALAAQQSGSIMSAVCPCSHYTCISNYSSTFIW